MISIDDYAVYVFVRQDLSEQDQRIQIAHAVLKMCLEESPAAADYRIIELDGGESKKAFDRTVRKMPERGVRYVVYSDSDKPEWGDTAIATIPLAVNPLPHKLRRGSSEKEHLISNQEAAGLSPAHGSNLSGGHACDDQGGA